MKDDALLIDEARAGDSAAFGELVRKYQDRLFNTVNMMQASDSYQEAEDVVQEAFIQAFVKLHTFRGKSAFYTWLYRIAYNVVVSRQRRKKAEVSVEHRRETTGAEPIDMGDGPAERLQREETVSQVQQALACLSHEHRTILVLREMEGCDYEAIAEILDMPIGTVRSRLHRARCQMRDQMKQLYQTHAAD